VHPSQKFIVIRPQILGYRGNKQTKAKTLTSLAEVQEIQEVNDSNV